MRYSSFVLRLWQTEDDRSPTELSFRGQFLQFVRSRCDIEAEVVHCARSGGKPFSVREIYGALREVL